MTAACRIRVTGLDALIGLPEYLTQCAEMSLRRLGVERVGATHCTGEAAMSVFKEAYGEDWVQAGAGRVLMIDGLPVGAP